MNENPEQEQTEDVEGHMPIKRVLVEQDADTEGHGRMHVTADDEATEGHMPLKRGLVEDDDETEGHVRRM